MLAGGGDGTVAGTLQVMLSTADARVQQRVWDGGGGASLIRPERDTFITHHTPVRLVAARVRDVAGASA
jgi:hypothetical protein